MLLIRKIFRVAETSILICISYCGIVKKKCIKKIMKWNNWIFMLDNKCFLICVKNGMVVMDYLTRYLPCRISSYSSHHPRIYCLTFLFFSLPSSGFYCWSNLVSCYLCLYEDFINFFFVPKKKFLDTSHTIRCFDIFDHTHTENRIKIHR